MAPFPNAGLWSLEGRIIGLCRQGLDKVGDLACAEPNLAIAKVDWSRQRLCTNSAIGGRTRADVHPRHQRFHRYQFIWRRRFYRRHGNNPRSCSTSHHADRNRSIRSNQEKSEISRGLRCPQGADGFRNAQAGPLQALSAFGHDPRDHEPWSLCLLLSDKPQDQARASGLCHQGSLR